MSKYVYVLVWISAVEPSVSEALDEFGVFTLDDFQLLLASEDLLLMSNLKRRNSFNDDINQWNVCRVKCGSYVY